jgi:ATP-dependent Lon protease
MSLGGLHDESEIRGHRKTYIGAMPGRIIQNIKKAKTSNPVFILDEIDKLSSDRQGDPSSALLEVLDPEQNNTFHDNYLDIDYDLSKVMFIATANSLSTVQTPLLDRMEIIQLSGYTIEEKVEIAKRHLIKKQMEENGLTPDSFKLGNKEIAHVVEAHTRESGVRRLEKHIAKIARWVALQITMEKDYNQKISIDKIDEILGVPIPKNFSEMTDVPGVVTGLAWTSVGGDILLDLSLTSFIIIVCRDDVILLSNSEEVRPRDNTRLIPFSNQTHPISTNRDRVEVSTKRKINIRFIFTVLIP